MRGTVHSIYIGLLFFLGVLAALTPALRGFEYYLTPLAERPFHPLFDQLKPTGFEGHGYGVIGTVLIIIGVSMYSTRKRIRALASFGKLRYFLEFHIFLCLVGPVWVLYHTTFKIGGLVAVAFWSMTAVVLSGIIGRYLYTQIPRGLQGNEIPLAELNAENERLRGTLVKQFGVPAAFLQRIDALALPPNSATEMKTLDLLRFFLVNDVTRRTRLRSLLHQMRRAGLQPRVLGQLRHIANRRIVLTRRIAFLSRLRNLFHYWHVVHLPFSIIMFVILFIHIAVAFVFGYRWIF